MSVKQLIFIALFVSGFFMASCKKDAKIEKPQTVIPVRTAVVVERDVKMPVNVSGTVVRKEQMKLSFMAGGIIKNIYVSEGDYVKKGRPLAALNKTEILAMVKQAQEGLDKTKRDFSRIKELYNDSVATKEQFQNAKTALNTSKANFDIAEYNLRRSSITAPTDGWILKQLVEKNEMVQQGYPVFLFSNARSEFVFRASVTDRDIVRFAVRDSAVVEFDAFPGQQITAFLSEFPAGANEMSGLYDIELTIIESNNRLLPGMFGKAIIFPGEQSKKLSIPVEALIDPDKKEGYVFILEEQSARRKRVTLGPIIGEEVIINSGLSGGQIVITEGSLYVRDGSRVKVISDERFGLTAVRQSKE